MIKYLILFISGKLYFTSISSKAQTIQCFTSENESEDLGLLLTEFCEKLSSNFEVSLFTDTLTLHTVDLSKQATAANASLVEQFLLFELEGVLDLLPENPVLKFLKDKDHLYHCLLTEQSVVNDLKNICHQFGGKLTQLGHPAGFLSSLGKANSVEIFPNTVHCQSLHDQCSFSLNSSYPTEYEDVQKWLVSHSLKNLNILNLSDKEIIPLEGNIQKADLSQVTAKELVKALKVKYKKSPVFILNKKNKSLKKQLPLIVSFFISLIYFSYTIFMGVSTNKSLEEKIDKKKVAKKKMVLQQGDYQKKIDDVPELEKKIAGLEVDKIVLENVNFWPALLETLAQAFDESSLLTKVDTKVGDSVSVEGMTLNVTKIQEVANALEQDKRLNINILEKSIQ